MDFECFIIFEATLPILDEIADYFFWLMEYSIFFLLYNKKANINFKIFFGSIN